MFLLGNFLHFRYPPQTNMEATLNPKPFWVSYQDPFQRFGSIYTAMGQTPDRTPSEHPNPTTKIKSLKRVVNSPKTHQNGGSTKTATSAFVAFSLLHVRSSGRPGGRHLHLGDHQRHLGPAACAAVPAGTGQPAGGVDLQNAV